MSAFRIAVTAIAPLMMAAAMLYMANGLLSSVLSLRLDVAGVSADWIGLVMATWACGFLLGTLTAPILVDRVGHIRCYAAFAAVTASCVLLHSLTDNLVAWMVLRLTHGAAFASLTIVIESWLNAKASNDIRGRIMSVYMIVYYISGGLGQIVLAVTDPSGYAVIIYVAILLALSLVPLALGRVAAPPAIPSARLSAAILWRISPTAVFTCLCCGLIVGGYISFIAVYGRSIADDTVWVAQVVAAGQLGGLVLQYPIGRLSDWLDRRQVIAGLAAATAVICLVVAIFGGVGGAVSLILVAAYAGVSFSLYPMALAHANDHMDSQQLVPGSAGLLMCYGVGATAGPLLMGPLIGRIGPSGLPAASGAVAVLILAFILYRMTRRGSPAAEDQASYVAAVPTTIAVAGLDPRSEPDDGQLAFDFLGADSAH